MTENSDRPLRIFLCHASDDKRAARALYKRLINDGVDAWLDEENLLPGQNWRIEIPKAIRSSDAVLVCLTDNSINKEGYVQKEIKYALDIAEEKPLGTIFIIPTKLDECIVPERLRDWQWVELYKTEGYKRLLKTFRLLEKGLILKSIKSPRLIIKALGQPKVLLYQKPVTLGDWQTQSVRELFFYFLTVKEAVTKEQIWATFWPDIEEKSRLKMRFKNDIYRLRKAIGNDIIIFESDCYSFNRHLEYQYDVEDFDFHVARAKSLTNNRMKINHYQAAIELVLGTYLSDIGSQWASIERERIKQEYLTTMLSLTELFIEEQELDKAWGICQRTLYSFSHSEEAHRKSMRIYAKLGNRVAVIQQYKECKDILQNKNNSAPSKETEDLYKELIREEMFEN